MVCSPLVRRFIHLRKDSEVTRLTAQVCSSTYCLRAVALLMSSTLDEYRNVTSFLMQISSNSAVRGFLSSSEKYLVRNSFHFAGSWEYHFLSSLDGAISLNHLSSFNFSFVIPRGHSRSTRILYPCFDPCSLYTLEMVITQVAAFTEK